tara:strand:- start:3377 stop:4237 length:861 start_codon:yes stop_codon:yes gene_type:complete
VTDPDFSNEVTLDRIREVPKEGTLFRVEHYLTPTHAKDGSAFSKAIQEKRDWLNQLVAPLVAEGFNIKTGVHAYGKLHETIIANAVDFGADYIFKPLRHHSTLRRLMYTSTDWNLIRFCPCPLLLLSEKSQVHGKPVLATLDLETRDEPHKRLNKIVLERAHALSDLIGGEVHIVNAYNMVTVAGGDASLDPLKYEVVQGRRDEYLKKAKSIAEANGVSIENIHLEEGAPEMVVNHVAESLGAGIIVLGTMARTGVSGMFIGNTAESVLEGANCDVFVIKQQDTSD